MLMAMTPNNVLMGRCLRFSKTSRLVKLFVGYDQALRDRRKLAHLAAHESSVAEHFFELRVGIRVTGGRAQHLHAKHRVALWRHAIVIGNKLRRDGDSFWRERGMHFSEQLLVGGWIEVMQKIRNKDDVVAGAEFHIERAPGD